LEGPVSKIARLAAGCALALSACAAHPAQGALPGDGIRVDVSGHDKDVVRLADTVTRATIAWDRLKGEPVRDSLVSPDNTMVAVRHGADDDGDSLAAYAIAWAVDPASGAKVGKVAHVLDYRPRDGHLSVSLRQVPNGTVVQVQSGRHPPLWRKIFFYESASGTWYEWPRALAPRDPTDGMPTTVGDTDTGTHYAAWLRPLDPHGD
jgi:hypothetical protein